MSRKEIFVFFSFKGKSYFHIRMFGRDYKLHLIYGLTFVELVLGARDVFDELGFHWKKWNH